LLNDEIICKDLSDDEEKENLTNSNENNNLLNRKRER
jgi:hypothetical protein